MEATAATTLSLIFICFYVGVSGRRGLWEQECPRQGVVLESQYLQCKQAYMDWLGQRFSEPTVIDGRVVTQMINGYCSQMDHIQQCAENITDSCSEQYKTHFRNAAALTDSMCDGTSVQQAIQARLDEINTSLVIGDLGVFGAFGCYDSVRAAEMSSGFDVVAAFQGDVEEYLQATGRIMLQVAQCIQDRLEHQVDPDEAYLAYVTVLLYNFWPMVLGVNTTEIFLLQ